MNCVSVFYRPPSSDSSQLDQLFDTVESLDIVNFSNYILLGDFFCNETHPCTLNYLICTNLCDQLRRLSSLLDRLSMEKTDGDGFFSRWLVCRSSDRSYNLTG